MTGTDDGTSTRAEQDAALAELFSARAWDERYRAAPALWSGQPNAQLVAEVPGLPPGRALDLGSGEGADALWLARQGWRVTAVDVSQVALERAAAQAATEGLADRTRWQQADLRDDLPADEAYDLVSAHYLHLPADPRGQLLSRVADVVVPGGTLLFVAHDRQDAHTGLRSHVELLLTPAEVVAQLDDALWEVVVAETRTRTGPPPGQDGPREPVVVHDAVVRARRR